MKAREGQNDQRAGANVQTASFTKLQTPRYRRQRASSLPLATANSSDSHGPRFRSQAAASGWSWRMRASCQSVGRRPLGYLVEFR
jgi:hypothetical protein